jgi:hypothetical protein
MPNPSVRSTSSATSSSATFTVTKPTGTASGDILYAIQEVFLSLSGVPAFPSGFSSAIYQNTYTGSYMLQGAWKLAGGSEPASYTFSNGTGQSSAVYLYAIQNAASSGPTAQFATDSGSGSSTDTGTATTGAGDTNHEVVVAAIGAATTTVSFSAQAFSDGTSATDLGTITDGTTLILDSFYGSQATLANIQGTATLSSLGGPWGGAIVRFPAAAAAPVEDETGLTTQVISVW